MNVITIEEHWTTAAIARALDAQPAEERDESVALNARGDIPARLLDIGAGRIAAMDAAGIDMQILSIAPPGTQGLSAADAVVLAGKPTTSRQMRFAYIRRDCGLSRRCRRRILMPLSWSWNVARPCSATSAS